MSRLKILIKTHPFTFASYNPFESLHIDHIGPLPVDDKGNSHILVMIDAFSRWVGLFPTKTTRLLGAFSNTLVDLEYPMSFTLIRVQPPAANFSQSYHGCRRSNIPSPQRTRKRRTVSSSVLIKKSCDIFVPCFLTHSCTTSGLRNSYPWYTGVTPAELIPR